MAASMERMRWVAVGVLGVAVVAALGILAGCRGWEGPLVADTRVKIVEPKAGSTVADPVIRWEWKGSKAPGTESGLWFGVYVDFPPPPPGQSALTAASTPCDSVAACLEANAINGPNVYLTDALQVHPTVRGGPGVEHRFTIVLVDDKGIRQGAVGWNGVFHTPAT